MITEVRAISHRSRAERIGVAASLSDDPEERAIPESFGPAAIAPSNRWNYVDSAMAHA
jgi:hypothetical protein